MGSLTRLAISVMVTLMTIAATVEQARAQRLRGPEPWAYERYASNNKDKKLLPASKLSVWNATLKEWDIRDTGSASREATREIA